MRRAQHHRRAAGSGALLAAVLLLGACGDGPDLPGYGSGGPDEETSDGPSATSSEDEPTDDADGTDDDGTDDDAGEPFEGGTELSTADPGGDAMLTVTDVRVGAHDGYDRVVFDLGGEGTPGWRVEYVDEALDDGSGMPVEVDGDTILQVSITGTAMPMDSEVTEYSGDTVEGPETVEEVVYRFVFEGITTAFIGVDDGEQPFRVFTLEDPTRLVVDVGH